MSQRVGQTRFEFEITNGDCYVNQALVLQKSPLHRSLEKYGRCTQKIFFFVTMIHIKTLGLHSDFLLRTVRFYSCLEVLNRTMIHSGEKLHFDVLLLIF